jgi:hypothetical protein
MFFLGRLFVSHDEQSIAGEQSQGVASRELLV